mmetsp:Transcript_9510/g.58020  ORF Transcript_9510/g.58020 Transcript_9510/m.58020 type:complete len:98 (+) Transcript_9510:1137-1430(+)
MNLIDIIISLHLRHIAIFNLPMHQKDLTSIEMKLTLIWLTTDISNSLHAIHAGADWLLSGVCEGGFPSVVGGPIVTSGELGIGGGALGSSVCGGIEG